MHFNAKSYGDRMFRVIRSAVRSLWQTPKFSLPVVLSLTVGLLGFALVGTVVDHVLLRQLAFQEPERLLALHERTAKGQILTVTQQNMRDLERETALGRTGLESLAIYSSADSTVEVVSVANSVLPFRAQASMVGSEFFRTLRIQPIQGRGFDSVNALKLDANVALISEQAWRTRFSADPAILDREVRVFGHRVKIIGVVSRTQSFPTGTEFWLPDRITSANPSRSGHNFRALARLEKGVSMSEAQAKLDHFATQWKAEFGESMSAVAFPVQDLQEWLVGDTSTVLWSAAAAALFLLLIAALNASNLWLVRIVGQRAQMVTKLSLGATHWGLSMELALQSLLLCLLALVLAGTFGQALLQLLQPMLLQYVPRAGAAQFDAMVWLKLGALACGLALLCVLIPTLTLRQIERASALVEGARASTESRNSAQLRRWLTASQTAITVTLLVVSLLLFQSVYALLRVDPGFRVDGVITASVSMQMHDITDAQNKIPRYLNALNALQASPGVDAVALTSALPLGAGGGNGTFLKEYASTPAIPTGDFPALIKRYNDTPEQDKGYAEFRVVSTDYFRTLEIPLTAGRFFEAGDTAERPHVAVISEALAKQSYPGQDPIGRRIQFGGMDGDVRPLTIIGVSKDVRESRLDAPPSQTVYVHLPQRPLHSVYASFLLRGSLPENALAKLLMTELNQRAGLPTELSTLAETRSHSLGIRNPLLVCFAGFVVLAMLLAGLGVFGLTRYNIVQKHAELYIRRAIGASSARLRAEQLAGVMRLQLGAIALGLITAVFASQAIAEQLFEVQATDATTFLISAATMLALCIGATLVALGNAPILREKAVLR